MVYGFRERQHCVPPIFSGAVSLESQINRSFFIFGHWGGMFTALAHGLSGSALNTERGAMDGVRYKGCCKPATM